MQFCFCKSMGPITFIARKAFLDLSAYMKPEDWQALLRAIGKTEEELLDRYKAVFHLCTSAKGAPNSYTLSNNSARMEETLAEAISVDDNLIRAWKDHPNLHIIESEEFVKDKIDKVLMGIGKVLDIQDQVQELML